MNAVTFDADGNVLAGGRLGDRAVVLKLRGKAGTELWRFVASESSAYDEGVSYVAVDPQDDVVMEHTRYFEAEDPVVTVRKLAGWTGAEIWQHTFSDLTSDGAPTTTVLDADGNPIVALFLPFPFAARQPLVIVKLDRQTGEELWRHVFDDLIPDSEPAVAMTVDPAGNVIVGKGVYGAVTILKLDGETGDEVWRHQRSESATNVALTVDTDGAIVVIDETFAQAGSHSTVAKLSGDTGSERWHRDINEVALERLSLTTDRRADIVLGGAFLRMVGGTPEYVRIPTLVKVTGAGGDTIWRQEAGVPENIVGVVTTGDGDVVTAGALRENGSADFADFSVMKFAGDSGAELWHRVIGSPGGGFASALAVEPNGDVVAAGSVQQTTAGCDNDFDFTVIKLEGASGRFSNQSGAIPTPTPPACHDHLLYVTVGGALRLFDGTTLDLLGSVPAGSDLRQVVVHPTKPVAYALDGGGVWGPSQRDARRLVVVDARRRAVTAEIPLEPGSGALSISRDGGKVFVANTSSNSVSVVDTTDDTVVATIEVAVPVAVDVHPDGRLVYVVGRDGALSVADAVTATVRARFAVCTTAHSVSLSPDGRFAWVSGAMNDSYDERQLFQVDAYTGRIVRIITPRDGEQSMGFLAFTEDGRLGIKSGQDYTNPLILDVQARTLAYVDCDCRVANCDAGGDNAPGTAAVWDATNRAYVGGWGGYAIDLSTRRIVGQISWRDLQGLPNAVAVGPCPETFEALPHSTSGGCAMSTQQPGHRRWVSQVAALLVFLLLRRWRSPVDRSRNV